MGADLSQAKPESVEVAKYACDLVIEECWKEIQSNKEKDDKKLPTAGGRRIPSPLQDTTEDLPPEMEQSPEATEATAPQLWPQTPQSPVAPPAMVRYIDYMPAAPPTFADSFNAGFAAGFTNTMGGMAKPNTLGHLGLGHLGYTCPAWPPMQQVGPILGNAAYANQAALYTGGYGAYNGYDHFSSNAWQGECNWGVSQGQCDMWQAHYPQANAPQWTGGGQPLFQPFSTQPMRPAVQQFPAPPAYPPQHMGCGRAPLTAQFFNGSVLNTQPFPAAPVAYPMPMRPHAAPPAMPPAHAAPPAPSVAAPPMAPTVAPMHPSPAMPPSGPPTHIPTLPAAMGKRTAPPVNATKEERRLAAQKVLREQRLLFQVLARGEELPDDHRSDASTTISTPGSSEKKLAVQVHEEEAPVAAIEQKNRVSQEVTPRSPQKLQPQEKAQWQPRLNDKQGGNSGKGVNQVWVAKEEKGQTGHGSDGRNRKTKGKGKNTTEQWRVKQGAEEQPTTNRQINQRGKKNHRNTGYHWYHYGY